MNSFASAKKWFKSFGLVLAIFLSAGLVAIVTTAVVMEIGTQFLRDSAVPGSQGMFKCSTNELNTSGADLSYKFRHCNAGGVISDVLMVIFIGVFLTIFALFVPWVALDGATAGGHALVLFSYVYIFGLAIYLSRIFEDKQPQTFEKLFGQTTRRAWLMTLGLMLIGSACLLVSGWLK